MRTRPAAGALEPAFRVPLVRAVARQYRALYERASTKTSILGYSFARMFAAPAASSTDRSALSKVLGYSGSLYLSIQPFFLGTGTPQPAPAQQPPAQAALDAQPRAADAARPPPLRRSAPAGTAIKAPGG